MSTRLAQAGAELNTITEFPAESSADAGTISATISSTKAKTGTFSLRHTTSSRGRGLTIPATVQIRGGFYINHAGISGASAASKPILLYLSPSAGSAHYVVWNQNTGNLELFVNAVSQATYAVSGGFSATNVWFHIGFTFKAHASTGYFTVYLDGVAILSYTGNTTNTNGIVAIFTGGSLSSQTVTWTNNMYIDDMYVDDDSGGTDLAPNSPRFLWSLANAAGHLAQFTPLSSTNISNVDDTDASAPDDDTTYNFAQSAGLTDEFNTTNITVPVGYSIVAAIPVAYAKKTNAGVASTIELVAYDGSNTTTGSPKTPTTAYSVIWDRFTVQPDTTVWSESAFNSCQFGYTSSGSY